ncbi:unnamed protein product, partial [Sphacelaria rigidula]
GAPPVLADNHVAHIVNSISKDYKHTREVRWQRQSRMLLTCRLVARPYHSYGSGRQLSSSNNMSGRCSSNNRRNLSGRSGGYSNSTSHGDNMVDLRSDTVTQ